MNTATKLKLMPIITTVKILGFIDNYALQVESFIITSVTVLSLIFLFSIFRLTDLSQLKYIGDGLIYTFYVYPNTASTINNNVLGAKSQQKEYPYKLNEIVPPSVTAKSILIKDVKTSKTLYEMNSDQPLAPASTTKLMTALVALDLFNLDDKLQIPEVCTTVEGNKAGFESSEEVIVEDLIKTLLIFSAGDSACALATAQTSYNEFIELMNEKARDFGMNNSAFTNPIGLDGVNGSHYSNARDLYILAKKATDNRIIDGIVAEKEVVVGNQKLYSTNRLLWEIPYTVGVKTGTTVAAGEVLIYEYDNDGVNIMIIVMGSSDRFSDTKNLLNWTLQSFEWEPKNQKQVH